MGHWAHQFSVELEKFESNHSVSLLGSMVGSKVNCFEHGLHGTINASLVITQSQFLASSRHVMYYIGELFSLELTACG